MRLNRIPSRWLLLLVATALPCNAAETVCQGLNRGEAPTACAQWLQRACKNPYRFDPSGALEKILDVSEVSSKEERNPVEVSCEKNLETNPVHELSQSSDTVFTELYRPATAGERLAQRALKAWAQVNEKKKQDFQAILSVYDSQGISKSISNQDARDSVDRFRSRILGLLWETSSWREMYYVKHAVSDQILDAAEDVLTEIPSSAKPDVQPGFFSILASQSGDTERFAKLLQRGESVDDGASDAPERTLTPYHAKMVLLYHLDLELHRKYSDRPAEADRILDQLARQLQLKADFSKQERTSFDSIVPHDGYFLGADASQVQRLLGEKPDPISPSKGLGADCTTFIQEELRQMGYPTSIDQDRLTSSKAAKGALSSFSEIEPLTTKSAQMLEPGDLIVFSDQSTGHAAIVVGYEGDPPQLVVISAAGGYSRTFLRQKFDLFQDPQGSCSLNPAFVSNEGGQGIYRIHLKPVSGGIRK